MAQHVAFIGLGNMGGPMAINVAKKGFAVTAFDLSEQALAKVKAEGCGITSDPHQAVKNADFVITMLPSGPIVESVMIDDQKLLDSIPVTALVIDCSTVAPQNSRRVAKAAGERGIHFVDAPVSGGTAGAAAGTLAFMCGGPVEDFERAKTVLQTMGTNIFHAGDHGAGSVAKICNNMMLAIHMIGTAETLQMGINNGLDPKVLSEIMLKSSGNNWSLEKYNPVPGVMENVPSSKGYQGGFMTNLMIKDLGLAMETAKHSESAVPMGSLAQSLFYMFKHGGEGRGTEDFSAILKLFK